MDGSICGQKNTDRPDQSGQDRSANRGVADVVPGDDHRVVQARLLQYDANNYKDEKELQNFEHTVPPEG